MIKMKKRKLDNPIKDLVPQEQIETKIFLIRGKKVMLDSELAALYKVSTKRLNEQVRRNKKRFPEDFMFQLSKEESRELRSQFATSKKGGRRYLPYAFTEQGVAMLSSVLNSDRAIEVNIQIMRVFVRLREVLATHKELAKKIEEHDKKIGIIFEMVRELLEGPKTKEKKIMGFQP